MGSNQGGSVTAPKNWDDIEKLVDDLAPLNGDAREAFKQSIVNDLLARGYSEMRANQLIDEGLEKRRQP